MRRSLTKRIMPDRSKITMKSENEIKYWIKHFGVTTKNWNTLLSESAIPQQAFGKSYIIVSLTFNENSGPPAAIRTPELVVLQNVPQGDQKFSARNETEYNFFEELSVSFVVVAEHQRR